MIDEAKGRNFETDVEGFYRRATKSGERNRRKISSQPGSFNATLGFRCTVEHVRLYEDRHPWPIKCPACCNEFVEQIGRLRLHERARCPRADCQFIVKIDPGFRRALSKAKAGSYDPFKHIWNQRLKPAI